MKRASGFPTLQRLTLCPLTLSHLTPGQGERVRGAVVSPDAARDFCVSALQCRPTLAGCPPPPGG
jgi:hypothetical protein